MMDVLFTIGVWSIPVLVVWYWVEYRLIPLIRDVRTCWLESRTLWKERP